MEVATLLLLSHLVLDLVLHNPFTALNRQEMTETGRGGEM